MCHGAVVRPNVGTPPSADVRHKLTQQGFQLLKLLPSRGTLHLSFALLLIAKIK